MTSFLPVPFSHLWRGGGEGGLRARFSVHPREIPSGPCPARPACFEGLHGHTEGRPEQWSHTGTVWCKEKKTHTWTETVCIYFCSFWLIDGFYFVEHLSHISFLLHIPITSCPLSWSLNSFLFKLCVVHLVKLNSKCKHTHIDTNTKCTQSHCIIVLMHTKMLVFEYFSYNWTHRSLCILI